MTEISKDYLIINSSVKVIRITEFEEIQSHLKRMIKENEDAFKMISAEIMKNHDLKIQLEECVNMIRELVDKGISSGGHVDILLLKRALELLAKYQG